MGRLRLETSAGPLRAVHRRLHASMLRRGEAAPELEVPTRPEGSYSPAVLELARANWRARMVHEHASAAVFSGLLPQLMAAEAPLDVKTAALKASIDELRHASLCATVVAFLGGEPEAETSLRPEPLPEHEGCSAREVALRNVCFAGCLSETVSVALLSEEREATVEPFVRRVVDQLAGDEVQHARLGWAYLAEALPTLEDHERARLPKFLRVAFAHLEAKMHGAMPLGPELPREELEQLEALGVTRAADGREIFAETIAEVVIPRLEDHGIAARKAWETRTAPGL